MKHIKLFENFKINEATEKALQLRKKVGKGELDLSKYEEMAEDFS